MERNPRPNYRNPLAEALLPLARAYQEGGKDALRKQFAKLYPEKVPPPSENKPAA